MKSGRITSADLHRLAVVPWWVTASLPCPVAEYRFAPPRKWRFDWAWPDMLIALEVEGGVWTGGRHTRGSGFVRDIEKYNAAAALGWRLIRCTPSTLTRTETIETIRRAMANATAATPEGAK